MRKVFLCSMAVLFVLQVNAGSPPPSAHCPAPPGPTTRSAADSTSKEPERLVASVLALTLGPFGAHRLYFGTVPKVPIIYGVTFGGFGVLALLDLGHILFTKDLTPYRNNDRVFMWGEPKPATTPP